VNKGDRVKFDHMGMEYEGTILEVTSSLINMRPHKTMKIESDSHGRPWNITVNTTLFPQRVRSIKKSNESR
jgi:hypothetical protein